MVKALFNVSPSKNIGMYMNAVKTVQYFIKKAKFIDDIQTAENFPGIVRIIGYKDKFTRDNIIDGEQVVIDDKDIKIQFDYPLNDIVHYYHKNENGFTRKELFRLIFDGYKKIYNGRYKI